MIKFKDFLEKVIPIIHCGIGHYNHLNEDTNPYNLGIKDTELKKHYSKYNKEHIENIKDYSRYDDEYSSGHNSRFINTALLKHKGKIDKIKDIAGIKMIKILDSALSLHKTPREITVHMGINKKHGMTLKTASKKCKRKTFNVYHPAFLSTSIDNRIAKEFHKPFNPDNVQHLLHIKLAKGSPGGYINHISSVKEEDKFILPRGHIIKIEKEPTFSNNPNICHWFGEFTKKRK